MILGCRWYPSVSIRQAAGAKGSDSVKAHPRTQKQKQRATYAWVLCQHIDDHGLNVIDANLHGTGNPEVANIGLGQRKGNENSRNLPVDFVGQVGVALLYANTIKSRNCTIRSTTITWSEVDHRSDVRPSLDLTRSRITSGNGHICKSDSRRPYEKGEEGVNEQHAGYRAALNTAILPRRGTHSVIGGSKCTAKQSKDKR